MGRYYDGDIEGKFWFAVQDSTAPEHLGAEPVRITYRFYNKELVKQRVDELKQKLGIYLEKLDSFFSERISYSDKELSEYLGIQEDEIQGILEKYADIRLGQKVISYMDKGNNYCTIDCEL